MKNDLLIFGFCIRSIEHMQDAPFIVAPSNGFAN
jgi:hypothetical protein